LLALSKTLSVIWCNGGSAKQGKTIKTNNKQGENNEKQRNSEQLMHCNTWKGSHALHGGDRYGNWRA
jgi:hypothetical protein